MMMPIPNWIDELKEKVKEQQALITELEHRLQDKPDYKTLIRLPTQETRS